MVPAMTGPFHLARTGHAGWALAAPLFRARVLALGGWRRSALAFAAGGASVLAMAPFHAFAVLWLTLPVLVWLVESEPTDDAGTLPATRWARLRAHPATSAALAGWWFGFGYFFAGLCWIGEAFFIGPRIQLLLMPFAISGLPAVLALFWAAACALARLPRLGEGSRTVLLAVTLAAAEYLRGHLFTGFPWNVIGYALTWPLPLMQSAAYLGIYGLSLLAVLVFALPLVLWTRARPGPPGRRLRQAALGIAAGPIAALAILGLWRLSAPPPAPLAGIKLRIVQPSVPQHEKWQAAKQETIFYDHIALSRVAPDGTRDDLAGVTHVIWPEAAMPFLPLDYPVALQAIGRMLPQGTQLIAGALRAEYAGEGAQRRRSRIFNSILVFGADGALAGTYDKIHLVPGGEYLPLRGLMAAIGLEPIAQKSGGFDTGAAPRPLLRVAGLPPVGPLICYEAIFPAAVVQGSERPGLLLNLTNDGWFGNSTGPRQHYHQARVRAVEEGLPLVRAANNGISAAFDPLGRELGALGLNVRGTLDVALPQARQAPLYALWRDLPFFGALLVLLAGLAWHRGRLPGAMRGT